MIWHRRRWLGFSLVAMAAFVVGTRDVVAQEVIDAKAAAYLRDRYLADMDTVHAKVMALANAIPADKYTWRPAQGVRSVSEVLMHVASEWLFYGPQSVGAKPPADFGPPQQTLPKLEKDFTTKAQARATRQGVDLLRCADESGRCLQAHRALPALEQHAGGGGVRDDRRSTRTPRAADCVRPLGGGEAAVE